MAPTTARAVGRRRAQSRRYVRTQRLDQLEVLDRALEIDALVEAIADQVQPVLDELFGNELEGRGDQADSAWNGILVAVEQLHEVRGGEATSGVEISGLPLKVTEAQAELRLAVGHDVCKGPPGFSRALLHRAESISRRVDHMKLVAVHPRGCWV